jgi:hypothetical protein
MTSPRTILHPARGLLHPARGLLHPAWLASLSLLALNDHVLKGAGLLPPVLTGKLSDVVGLVVAPLLLAALLRVRSWGPWVACHVAVGAVFSAIQLSAPIADGWSALMGLVGFPWVITRDPTDLLALPALAASLWGFVPVMQRRVAANARRTAEAGAAAVGLLCCAATSDDSGPCCDGTTDWGDTDTSTGDDVPEVPPELPPFPADVYLSNATGQDVVIRIRALRPDVLLDCDAVAEAPGRLLHSALFAPATSWSLPPSTNVAVIDHPAGQAPCYAAWVEADALAPAVLLWSEGDPGITSVPAHGQSGLPGEVLVGWDGLDGLTLTSSASLVFAIAAEEPEGEGVCAPQAAADRLGWSSPVPWGPARVDAVEVGLDGCLAIDLTQGEELSQTWYLCVPATSFPFAAGDEVELRLPAGSDPALDSLEIVALDVDGEPLPLPTLLVSAGAAVPEVEGIDLAAVPQYGCALASEPVCGTVERPMAMLVSGPELPAAELVPGGEPLRERNEVVTVEVMVLHAQERFVLDPACDLGPDLLGPDLEVVIAKWPTEA